MCWCAFQKVIHSFHSFILSIHWRICAIGKLVIEFFIVFCFSSRIDLEGKIEVFAKHDHTQFKLLASADDPTGYNAATPLNYMSFASFNNTPTDFYFDCSMIPNSFIDTQLATRYAPVGHPLLLDDPNFDTPVDKRNCKI